VKYRILDLSHLFSDYRKKLWVDSKDLIFQNIEYEVYSGDVEEFQIQWPNIKKRYDVILLSEAYSPFFFAKLPQISTWLLTTGMMDCIYKEKNGDWLPSCFMRKALPKAIGVIAPELKTSGIAILSGLGELMKCSFATLNQLGFNQFRVVLDEELDTTGIEETFKKYFFNIDVKIIQTRDLTVEENSGNILVNTVTGDERSDFLESLSYLNFIHKGGVVIDFDFHSAETHLSKESVRVGLHTLHGFDLQGLSDFLLLTEFGILSNMTSAEYLKKWSAIVNQVQKK
jgi:hypothetical protein